MAIIQNKSLGQSSSAGFALHITANDTIVVVGNSSTSGIALTGETIAAAHISQVWWGSSNSSYWTVKRGSNTVTVLSETGYLDFAGNGLGLQIDQTANLVFTLTGSGVGFLALEGQKKASGV
jgi:hypothetical protein